ncbi:DegT/DnrJ/EryC1/StrS family aminotransferase [Tunicatimonas pelagia]|uniref:DegT/DnrJ/EryC1/StrS family aminotransferase n=1 Tax=Tunicatimonas pelagia TaxID=931531 RepID=UPI0026657113|nr:DegT/DnrJ/EryC1/StrS family aminotransferase [Tunicatimonas pelagia]WKN42825.1 DegT/DnrJ/EryC1/StrS family aminotransferase [Tunicatimonas pelagia]
MVTQFIQEVRRHYQRPSGAIYLIETAMFGNEHEFINNCLDSRKVSTIGEEVGQFEETIARRLGVKYALATSSGTAALHLGLMAIGVKSRDWVLTSPFTFIATSNAILQAGGQPLFIDIERATLGLSPTKLEEFLVRETYSNSSGHCYHRASERRIAACLPIHVFGHPANLPEIDKLCRRYNIPVLEDAAEGLGSSVCGQSVGTFGDVGVVSFNGNKIITSGGGGMLLTDDESIYRKAFRRANQLKSSVNNDVVEVNYNYRMPALNAALGLAQWQHLDQGIQQKRTLYNWYSNLFSESSIEVIKEPSESYSNYWLQAIVFSDQQQRDSFVEKTNEAGIETRAAWKLLHRYPLFNHRFHTPLPNAEWAESCIANIPSTIMPDA